MEKIPVKQYDWSKLKPATPEYVKRPTVPKEFKKEEPKKKGFSFRWGKK